MGNDPIVRPPKGGWRCLYGGFRQAGVSIETLEFELRQPFEWSRAFHAGSLALCLNLTGHGSVCAPQGSIDFEPLSAGFYASGKPVLKAWRIAGEHHRFTTMQFAPSFLRARLASCDGALHSLVEDFVRNDGARSGAGDLRRLSPAQEHLVDCLLNPPVPQGGRALWYEGKLLELMAEFFFVRRGEDELFCDRQKRLARSRVERVRALIERDLARGRSLEELGREAGCSSFYLSRTFSREMGMTIPQYLRKRRMERAAELLQSGKYNVTEAAMEVGYSSLSHFSLAFCQTMGCCPGLYPIRGTPGQTPEKILHGS